jgi:hypothetical protein
VAAVLDFGTERIVESSRVKNVADAQFAVQAAAAKEDYANFAGVAVAAVDLLADFHQKAAADIDAPWLLEENSALQQSRERRHHKCAE